TFEGEPHVHVVAALDQPVAAVLGRDRSGATERLGQGREPLLTVQEQPLWLGAGCRLYTVEQLGLEPDLVIPGLEEHEHTQRVTAQDGDQKLTDPLVIPLVTTLEVRQLDLARLGPLEVLTQLVERGLEAHQSSSRSRVAWAKPGPAVRAASRMSAQEVTRELKFRASPVRPFCSAMRNSR